MEPHQLRYFIAVADSASFTRAAERLHVSQSGVSAQIRRLERALGVELFDRTSRHVRLTSAGTDLLETARVALRSLDAVREHADALLGAVRGTVRLGLASGLVWAPPFDAIAAIHARHPGLEIRVEEGGSAELRARVRDGRLDLAIVSEAGPPPADLRTDDLVVEHLAALVPADHPLAGRTSIAPADLATQDTIVLPPGSGSGDAVQQWAIAAGAPLPARWEVSNPAMARLLATRGLGVALLATSAIDAAETADGLRRIGLSGRTIEVALRLVRRVGTSPSPAVETVAHTMLTTARPTDAPPRTGGDGVMHDGHHDGPSGVDYSPIDSSP